MSRQAISAQRHVLRALGQWPKDTLRPQIQFQDVLRKRFESSSGMSEQDQLKQANALYSLLDNRYKKTYPITGSLLRPRSKPTYFTDLVKELEEAPTRSYLDRLWLRVKGIVRIQ
ncbi:uncharacterized protein F4817DRAFT_345337 [Daldinia loculata]|uniref:uncharacterized protein n=1 Tax=Daldinia loculata TaxID=103429 RepID=UPI0020C43E2C|nr:uncharacterized protein F4817DRAFT_345337 [Daldinia loculata]KAI1645015.1 hypothetical protein F4817DRAFT_345337 [Daldinia loculata]